MTLVGVGGVGKTRLALQLAAEVVPRFADGAWLCELAAASDADTTLQVVAATLGVQARQGGSLGESIVDALRPKRQLVVLDNCEHQLRAVAGLAADILRACPDVRLLATSREGLGVAGEQIWPLASLTLPESAELDRVGECDAVRLFVDRAHAARPGFALSETNAARGGRDLCPPRWDSPRDRARGSPGRGAEPWGTFAGCSTNGSGCSPVGATPPSSATRPCAPRSTGRIRCSTTASGWCSTA